MLKNISHSNTDIAIFDFCGTLIRIQSAPAFIKYVREKKPSFQRLSLELARILLKRANVISGARDKSLYTRQLSGITMDEMQSLVEGFVNNVILKNENDIIKDKLVWHKEKGHTTIILSAGFSEYIEYFASLYEVDYVIATNLQKRDGIFTGSIEGRDCKGVNKIYRLGEIIDLSEVKPRKMYAYGDSYSDIPVLALADEGYVVGAKMPDWAKTLGYHHLGDG